ncbi:hypothetical protein CRG98_043393 [Punica granatum]|uniref:Leucine-rich repeat extensin-like protein 3 n=1 Tax=Punica granatum TaxID=22663 RepID=A0A2I0HWW5_PUNGR|nr:hypothetical protein CRG98_043393 [Punica granatum]
MGHHLNNLSPPRKFCQLPWLSKLVLLVVGSVSMLAITALSDDPVGEPTYNMLCISDCPTCPTICSPPPPNSPNPTYGARSPPPPLSPLPSPPVQYSPTPYFYFLNPPPSSPPPLKRSPPPLSPPPPSPLPSPPMPEVPSIYPYWGAHPPPPPPPPPYKPHNSPQAPPHNYSSNNPYYYFYASDNASPGHRFLSPLLHVLPFLCFLLQKVM